MQTNRRLVAFDGLKGLSMIMIILYHLMPQWIPGGFLFVNTFLVIGGYFVARKLETIAQSQTITFKSISSYIISTFKRIYLPVFWMVMIVSIILLLVHKQTLWSLKGGLMSSLLLAGNWYQIMTGQSYFVRMSEASPLVHLWYNALYFQSFLLAVGLVCVTVRYKLKAQVKAMLWLGIALVCHCLVPLMYQIGQDPSRVYYGLDTRFASFAVGIALFYLVPILLNLFNQSVYRLLGYQLLGLLSLVIMIYMVLTIKDQAASTYFIWLPLFSYLSAALIFSILIGHPLLNRLFSMTYLAHVGHNSYHYYLWYYPVIVWMMHFVRYFPHPLLFVGVSYCMIDIVTNIYTLGFNQAAKLNRGLIKQAGKGIWHQVKVTSANLGKPVWQVVFLLLLQSCLLIGGLCGVIYARDDMPLARFESEYRLFQSQSNFNQMAYPGEGLILKNKAYLGTLDQGMGTNFSRKTKVADSTSLLFGNSRENAAVLQELQTLKNQYADQLAAVQQAYPDAYELLTPYEVIFAYELPVTFFGDSLIKIDGEWLVSVYQQGNYFGYISLQIWDALPIFEELVHSGLVHDIVVINLGTNAGLDQETMDQLVSLAGDRELFFVNTNSKVMHIEEVNSIIKATADKYDHVHVIDWHSYQAGHPDWYASDEIHHSVEGTRYFIKLVTQVLQETLQ